MVFIKGTPDSPECGFSRTIIEILRQYNYPFGYFNIYSDDEVAEWIVVLKLANLPTAIRQR